ncbi:MAG: hypothetical protein P8018_08695, partial [Acidobacteriota bacterium]
MAVLDKVLGAMGERKAHAVTLKAGEIPTFHVGKTTQPVLKQALPAEHVLAYLKELAPSELKHRLDEASPCAFKYKQYDV